MGQTGRHVAVAQKMGGKKNKTKQKNGTLPLTNIEVHKPLSREVVFLQRSVHFHVSWWGTQKGLPWKVETWTKTCGLPLLFHFEPQPCCCQQNTFCCPELLSLMNAHSNCICLGRSCLTWEEKGKMRGVWAKPVSHQLGLVAYPSIYSLSIPTGVCPLKVRVHGILVFSFAYQPPGGPNPILIHTVFTRKPKETTQFGESTILRQAHVSVSQNRGSPRQLLGPPVVPFYPFWGEGSPTKIDCRKKGYPYSKLSTGGPRLVMCVFL